MAERPSETVEQTLASFADLPDGWDSYGADPIDPRAIEVARQFIESVNVSPTNKGGVSVWWMSEAVSIEFGPDGSTTGFWFDLSDISMWLEAKARQRPDSGRHSAGGER